MTQQLDNKKAHVCFKILEKNAENSELDMRVTYKATSCVNSNKNKKTTKKEFRNFTENKDTVRSLLDNALIL